MKRFIRLFSLVLVIALSGCATKQVYLEKTVWFNASPSEKDGQEGTVVTSLYFISSERVDIYNSVVVDSTVVVKPFLYAKGKYITESCKRVNEINIQANSIDKKNISFKGYYNNEDLFLVEDSICKSYVKLLDVELP